MTRTFKPLWLILLLSSAMLSGCGKEGELKGQIFIRTKGSENVKLGVVSVALYPESVMSPFADSVQVGVAHEQRGTYDEFRSLIVRAGVLKARNERPDGTVEENQEVLDYIKNVKKTALAIREWDAGSFVFSKLPQGAIAQTVSDADGRFIFKLPRNGRFAIAAQNSRQVGDNTEKYYWFVWVALDGAASKEVILSNHNLLTTTPSPEQVVTLPSLSAEEEELRVRAKGILE